MKKVYLLHQCGIL